MPVPNTLLDIKTNANLNSPSGSENVGPNLDNYLRTIAALLRADGLDKSFERWGDTPTYISATSFSVAGDLTARYFEGRRLRFTVGSSTLYGVISAVSYASPNTIVTVVMDSSPLAAGLTEVALGIDVRQVLKKVIDATLIKDGSITTTLLQDGAATVPKLGGDVLKFTAGVNVGRLTLASGTPITSTDVTSSNLYFTPYNGNMIALYDGAKWVLISFAEVALALSGLTANQGYDVFGYLNAGALAIEILAWTNNTTRATALAKQDGVTVKSGDATRRYLGSFMATSATTTEDSQENRYLYNYNNRVRRTLRRVESAGSWGYAAAATRYANNNNANRVAVFRGTVEDDLYVRLDAFGFLNSAGTATGLGIGVDSASAFTFRQAIIAAAINDGNSVVAPYRGNPGLGFHYISWLESGSASFTMITSAASQSMLHGDCYC